MAHTLTTLLKKGTKCLAWISVAEVALSQLKRAFTTAPVLKHPNPSKPFIIEVNISETGFGAILSQCFGESPSFTHGLFLQEAYPN